MNVIMKRILLLLLAGLCTISCNDENMYESSDGDNMDVNKVYSDVDLSRNVIYNLYGRMRLNAKHGTFSVMADGNTSISMLDNATDDGVGQFGRTLAVLERHLNGAINSSTNPVASTHPWTWFYRSIREANDFLANIDRSPLDEEEKTSLKAQARFLRALFYHEIYRWFGPFVITETPLDPFAFSSTKREDEKTSVEWLIGEFDALLAENVLPDVYTDAEHDFGRATKGMVLGYKARTLLYAASPLHADAGSGVTWAQAAQAALDLIEYADQNGIYELYVDPTQPELSYRHFFTSRYNKEIILSYMRADANDIYMCMPHMNPWNSNKELATCPTQWLIDSYDMVDGQQPITGYKGIEPIINPASGYDDQKPFANRDPRLSQSILHDGMTWPKVNNHNNVLLDISVEEQWKSGYFLVKYLDERIDHMTGGKTCQNFPMMRYAEVLLNYAEAINEADNSSSAREKAVAQLNRIRTRAGITTPLKASDYTQATLRERIRKERRVELCYEEHRFFDIKRWKIAAQQMVLPGVGIRKVDGKYERWAMDSRVYSERMNLMPLPKTEVNNCPNVYQNPGY